MSEQLEFRISSGLKNIIGKELITDDFIAIFELVKNSYDANAKQVELVFCNVKDPNKDDAKIFVIDNGDGMSLQELKELWLFVGYSEKRILEEELRKVNYRDKIGTRRIFAGAKGIGRFSCDRLGSILNVYTKKENDRFIHKLHVDWSKFEDDSKAEFQTIKVDYSPETKVVFEDIDIADFKKGTILEIFSLNATWERNKLLRLKRHLQRLINPTEIEEEHEFMIYLTAKEHTEEDEKYVGEKDHEVVNGHVANVVFEKLGIKTTQLYSRITEDGNSIITEVIDKGKFIFSIKEENEFELLYDVNVKLFYLNRQAKSTFTRLMGVQPVRYGSVFFYKNGIKINPCGNEADDWLSLDRRKTQGTRRFLGNRELMGRIEVNGYQPKFQEVSSRDGGVIKTPELGQLKKYFNEKVLRRLEKYVVQGIAWDNPSSKKEPKDPEAIKVDSLKIINQIVGQVKDEKLEVTFNEDLLEIYEDKQLEKTPEIIKSLENLKKYIKSEKEIKYVEDQVKTVLGAFKKYQVKQKELELELKRREEQIIFLEKVQDDEKIDIIGLQHHIGIATSTIDNHLLDLKYYIENAKHISLDYLVDIIDNVMYQTHIVSTIIEYITKANFDVMTETITKDLVEYIKQYVNNVYYVNNIKDIEKNDIKINILTNNISYICQFKPLDMIVILDNLINNSIKAKSKNIIITTNLEDDALTISMEDDGVGIPENILSKIYQFGFTTTDGSGIGLYHVKRLMDNNNWRINATKSALGGAKFTIKVMK